MATRSLIGIKNKNNSIDYIYCHFDGYVTSVGRKLIDFYKDEKTIRQLLNLGDLSVLGYTPVVNENAWKDYFADKDPNLCITYRTRGEKDVDFKTCVDLSNYIEAGNDHGVDYIYLFDTKENKWVYVYLLTHENLSFEVTSVLDGKTDNIKES
ncbi:MAG: hypothetical protein M0Q88_01185 [Bacilli bacterium]|nr:hypothetical protein [Bacilli bacterium]